MIPPKKLKNLPLPQGKRKTAKIFEEAEHRLINGSIQKDEAARLAEILDYWIKNMSANQSGALETIRKNLVQADIEQKDLRRNLNNAKYIFLNESGRYPSEWDFDATDSDGRLDPAKRKIFSGMEIFLEDIRSPFNVGAMFRTAESFGAQKIYLSRYCADPGHKRAQRTAMGCTEIIPWSRIQDGDPFRDNAAFPPDTKFFALETGGIRLDEFNFPQKGVMIAGSEELGVSPAALAACDASLGRVSIPVYGAKGSLNVSVAFGIVMHAWAASLENSAIGKIVK